MKTPFYYLILLCGALLLTQCKEMDKAFPVPVAPVPPPVPVYTTHVGNLIGINNLEQLHVMRWDVNGDGVVTDQTQERQDEYAAAFGVLPDAPEGGWKGYALIRPLNFDEDDSYDNPSVNKPLWAEGDGTGKGWSPLGYYSNFDGQGHTIDSLYINRPEADIVGLFGWLGGHVHNLGLRNPRVTGKKWAGSMAGHLAETGRISDCYVLKGNMLLVGIIGGVGVESGVGGMVGKMDRGTISNSYVSESEVRGRRGSRGAGSFNVGGLVARVYPSSGAGRGEIRNCYVVGSTVHGPVNVGGLVGENAGGLIKNNYVSRTTVGGDLARHGGLVGRNRSYIWRESVIVNCYVSESTVHTTAVDSGGLVGQNGSGSHNTLQVIRACYVVNTRVDGGGNAGGLVGYNRNKIDASYVAGVTVVAEATPGGLVGYNEGGMINACYVLGADVDVTLHGIKTYAGGLVAEHTGTFTACYVANVSVELTDPTPLQGAPPPQIGGLVGKSVGTMNHSYYQIMQVMPTGREGPRNKFEATLKAPTSYTDIYANWNIDIIGDANADDPWDFGTNEQYPVLKIDFNNSDGDDNILTGVDDDIARQRM